MVVNRGIAEKTFLDESDLENLKPYNKHGAFVDEMFAFRDDEEGDILFYIDRLKDAIINGVVPYQVIRLPITSDIIDLIKRTGGVELDYLEKEGGDITTPTITVIWKNNEATLIDGNHRVLRRAQAGAEDFRTIILHWPYWRSYSAWRNVEGLPEGTEYLFEQIKSQDKR